MTTKVIINTGDIWFVELTVKDSDTLGHEQGKTRPCLVIGDNPNLEISTIIPLTSNLNANRFPNTHLIRRNAKNGLKSNSVALIFHMRSLSYIRFKDKLGAINEPNMNKIKELIRDYLNL